MALLLAFTLLLGVMQGVVTTDGGAPLPDVKITLDGLRQPLHFAAQSDATGRYSIANVPPGAYTVAADAKGFGCVVIPRIVLEAGQPVKQDFQFLHGRQKPACSK
jgi:hypothetical protein